MPTLTFVQTRGRWRNDNGGEVTATWKAAESTDVEFARDINVRLRLQVDVTVGTGTLATPTLRYSHNSGAYTAVSASSSVIRASESPHITDGVATTALLTAAGGSFVAGSIDEVNGACASVSTASGYTEVEYVFQVRSADVAVGDTVDFRVYNNTTALNTYTVTPRVTIIAAGTKSTGTIDNNNAIFPSAARTHTDDFDGLGAGVYASPEMHNLESKGVDIFVNTTSSGSGTVTVKLQKKDPASGSWFDIPSATGTAVNDPADEMLSVYPNIAETANISVSDHLGFTWRVIATVATAEVTFSVGAQYLY